MPFLTRATLLLFFCSALRAADIEAVNQSAEADLKQALSELAELQQSIAAEKAPLARRLNEIEEKVALRRRELERSQRAQENQLVDLNVLKAEVKRQTEEMGFLSGLLTEYTRLFETRIHISEAQIYKELFAQANAAVGNPDLSATEKAEKGIAVIQTSLERARALPGGESFSGQALVENGRLETGKFLLLGPVAVFSSEQSESAGIVELQLGSPEPAVISLGSSQNEQIRATVAAGAGELPIDPTSGNALKIASQRDTLWGHIRKGGPVMVPILLLGVAALIICLVKWWEISRIRAAQPRDLQIILDNLEEGKHQHALFHARGIRGPVGEMLAAAIEHVDEKKEYIEEIMYEKMLAAKPRLERLMPVIALSAATAPLLGLLGTVTGMINTFNMITVFGTGDPRTLASGISEALITTEFGLVIAIPSLLMHAFISRKAKGFLSSMEKTGVAFINGIPTPKEERDIYA